MPSKLSSGWELKVPTGERFDFAALKQRKAAQHGCVST